MLNETAFKWNFAHGLSIIRISLAHFYVSSGFISSCSPSNSQLNLFLFIKIHQMYLNIVCQMLCSIKNSISYERENKSKRPRVPCLAFSFIVFMQFP